MIRKGGRLQGRRHGRKLHSLLLASAGFLVATSCTDETPNMLEPHGPGAQRIEGLFWLMTILSAIVFLIVAGILAYAFVRSRRSGDPDAPAPWGGRFIAIGGLGIPFVILAALFLVSLRDMDALSSPPGDTGVTIEVVAHDWWWEAIYPNGAIAANEIHVPVGTSVRLTLATDDVIHSFWVPQLQVKMDLIPGRTNELWIQADEAGRYRGQCAEFCGIQHANMAFYVVAEAPEDFETWMAGQSNPAAEPTTSTAQRGLEVFTSSTCAGCHAIRGTEADASAGPDLTHLAGRDSLASGTIANTRADLRRWIVDPQSVKPGAAMPPTDLDAEELEALLDYLEGLE